MSALLRRAAWRHLRRRPWQLGSTVLGVAFAVAVVVGIDLANASAERAFLLSVEGVAGRATHELVGGPTGLDEEVYARLRLSGLAAARRSAPVVEGRVLAGPVPTETSNESSAGRAMTMLGIDPLAEAAIRDLTRGLVAPADADAAETEETAIGDLGSFLADGDAAGLSSDAASALGLEALGDPFVVAAGDHTVRLRWTARLDPSDALARRSARDLIVVDLAVAQAALGRSGQIDRVDLRLEPGEDTDVRAAVGAATTLRSKEARASGLAQMTRAFRLNLTALSLLALVVGMFLVYNTMTFSVVERRPLLGRLRSIGVTRREILSTTLLEAVVLGGLGTLVGAVLGWLLAHGLLRLVSQTINDLYFAVSVTSVELPAAALAKALALGLGGSTLAALRPALEATAAPPRAVLQRSNEERRGRDALPGLLLASGALAALAWGLLAASERSLILAFAAVFATVLAVACAVPAATWAAGHLIARPARRLAGSVGAMAARGVAATLSRTGIATAALAVAIATTVGVGVMIDSFRGTLVRWLDTTLVADVFVTSTEQTPRGASPLLDDTLIDLARTTTGVTSTVTYRRVEVDSPRGPTQLHALDLDRRAFDGFALRRGDPDRAWSRLANGDAVLASEPYAWRHGLDVGDVLELATDAGAQRFEVAGVFADYATDRGRLLIPRRAYDRHWSDRGVQSLGLFVEPTNAADRVAEALRTAAGPEVTVMVNRELRALSLDIFDRTFRITAVLRLLAIGVAFVGVLSALMALQLERRRELGVLRALGMTPAQVWGLVTAQTALLGVVAGLVAAPFGVLLAAQLVHVINKRSFGWTLEMTVDPAILGQALLLAVIAALAAGIYPAHKMARARPADALRSE